jgi:hypothetical protein
MWTEQFVVVAKNTDCLIINNPGDRSAMSHVSYKSKDSSHVDHSGSWGYSSVRPKSVKPKDKGSCTSGPPGSLVKLGENTAV